MQSVGLTLWRATGSAENDVTEKCKLSSLPVTAAPMEQEDSYSIYGDTSSTTAILQVVLSASQGN